MPYNHHPPPPTQTHPRAVTQIKTPPPHTHTTHTHTHTHTVSDADKDIFVRSHDYRPNENINNLFNYQESMKGSLVHHDKTCLYQ